MKRKDILQEIINYDTKVNMRKELERKGYKKKVKTKKEK